MISATLKSEKMLSTVTNPDPARVFIVAKSDFAIEGLQHMLARSDEIRLLACVEAGDGCWHKLNQEKPDVLLMHVDAVQTPIGRFIADIKKSSPLTRIIVFGQKMSQSFIRDAVMAGVSGYINEKMNSSHLLRAIKDVRDGRLWVERALLEEMAARAMQIQSAIEATILEKIDSVRTLLTARETTVLQLVLDGLSTKAIARKMCVSEQSVKMHLSHMFAKFGVNSRAQLILQTYARVCPVTNMIRLFRMSLDKRRLEKGLAPLIRDPLESP